MSLGVSIKGDLLVKAYHAALANRNRARIEAQCAEDMLAGATRELGDWLMPMGAVCGEKIGFWYSDEQLGRTEKLITVEKIDVESYRIEERRRL